MFKVLKKIHKITAVFGFICVYCAISTSDYHTIVTKTDIPDSVDTLLFWGLVLFAPTIICLLHDHVRGGK